MTKPSLSSKVPDLSFRKNLRKIEKVLRNLLTVADSHRITTIHIVMIPPDSP